MWSACPEWESRVEAIERATDAVFGQRVGDTAFTEAT